jgi:hypothetical protein
MESQMSRSLVAGLSGSGAEASAPHATHARLTYEAFTRAAPAAHAALTALGKAVDDSGLEKELTELVEAARVAAQWLRVLRPIPS